eukprot:m.136697 g.136697  ORF g.136697 m.136697 type:complete len:765 (-) comp16032_c0_seq2:138-2432(-)
MSATAKTEQLQGLIELCLNDNQASEHVTFMVEAIRSRELLQTTRQDSDLASPIVTAWFKRLNSLTTNSPAKLRHTAIQLLAISIPACLPVTFCDNSLTWTNLLTKHAFKADVPAVTQATALVALQDLLYHSQKHSELRREMASTVITPLLKLLLGLISSLSSPVILVTAALQTATVAVRSYPGASKSQAGKLRQACQRLFGEAARRETSVQQLAATLFAETSRCVTAKAMAEHWATLLQDSMQTCLHLLSFLAPDYLDDETVAVPKLPLPTLPSSQPTRQLAIGRQLTGLLAAVAALLRLELANAVSLDLKQLLSLLQACIQLDAAACTAVQLRTQRLLLIPMLAKLHLQSLTLLKACVEVAGLALLPASNQCWGLLERLWETSSSTPVKVAVLTTAVEMLSSVGPSVSLLTSKQLTNWVNTACKHVAGQAATTTSMLSGTVDTAMSHRGKRKQSSGSSTKITPIGFDLCRPGANADLTLAALQFLQALVTLAGHQLPNPTIAHLHRVLETQASACLQAPRPAPFSDERCWGALTETLSCTTNCLHATIASPMATTLSYLQHASATARPALAALDASVRSRHPGVRNPPARGCADVMLTEARNSPSPTPMDGVDESVVEAHGTEAATAVVVSVHQGSQTEAALPVQPALSHSVEEDVVESATFQPEQDRTESVEVEPAAKHPKLDTPIEAQDQVADQSAVKPDEGSLKTSSNTFAPVDAPADLPISTPAENVANSAEADDDIDFGQDMPDVVDEGPDSEDEGEW